MKIEIVVRVISQQGVAFGRENFDLPGEPESIVGMAQAAHELASWLRFAATIRPIINFLQRTEP